MIFENLYLSYTECNKSIYFALQENLIINVSCLAFFIHFLFIIDKIIMSLKLFLESILPSFLLVTGVLCNFLSFLVFSRKKIKKMSLNYLFRLMAITDTLTLIQLTIVYKDFYILRLSRFTCKFFIYFGFTLFPIKGK